MRAHTILLCLLLQAVCTAPCLAQQPDSLDQVIHDRIDETFNTTFYENADSAFLEFDQEALLAEKHQRWHLVVKALVRKAECAFHYHQFARMEPILARLHSIQKQHQSELDQLDPDYTIRNDIDYMQSMYYYSLGDFDRCITNFEMMINRGKKLNNLDPLYLYGIHSFIGYSYFQLLLYDKAYVQYELALNALLKRDDLNTDYEQAIVNLYKGTCLEYKAQALNEHDLYSDALVFYKRAMTLMRKLKGDVQNQSGVTSAYLRLATAHRLLGHYDSAQHYIHQSFRYHADSDPLRARSYQSMGDVFKEQKQYSKALDYYEKSRLVTNRNYTAKHFERSTPLFKKAETFLALKNYDSALWCSQLGIIEIVKDFNDRKNLYTLPSVSDESNVAKLLDGLTLKGKILFESDRGSQQENLMASLACYTKAIELIQAAQLKYPESEFRQTLAAKAQPLFEAALEAAHQALTAGYHDRDYRQLIFSILELNKSTLVREVVSSTLAKAYSGVPTSILSQESLMKGTIMSMRAQLYQRPGDEQVNTWKEELYSATRRYDSLINRIRQDYPRYYQLKYGDQRVNYQDIQATLPDKTVLIEFFWGDSTLFAACVSKKEMIINRVPITAELKETTTTLIEQISHPPATQNTQHLRSFATASHRLYDLLLNPMLSKLVSAPSSLVIIPDGLLSYLPFDVLLTEAVDDLSSDYSRLPYMARQYTIRNLFTASLLSPVVRPSHYMYDYIGFAPQYAADYRIPADVRGSTPFAFLLHNTEEIQQASTFFNSKTYTHQEATEEQFRQVATHGKILHLSMHAFTHDHDPSFSGLVFTPPDSVDDQPESSDGLLHLYELYNLALAADLAVLSACETGTGKYTRGEGIISLGKAFRYAGCNNIVMSLWNVNDKSTAEIMKVFFRNLDKGMNKDEALQKAKLHFLEHAPARHFAHPFYWSTFILTGDVEPVTTSTNRWIIAGAIVCMIIVVVLIMKWITFKQKQAR